MRATGWIRRLTIGTRVFVGAFLAVVIVVVVIASVRSTLPGISRDALRIVATPTPAETVAVCPGPVFAAGRMVGAADAVSIAAAPTFVSGSPQGTPRDHVLSTGNGEGARVYRLAPAGGEPASVVAAQSVAVSDEDLAGFDAAACTAPQFDSWLVGGATTTGSSALVVLANPGAVPATVQVTVYASGGALTPPGGADVVVAPGTQVALSLAGLALGEIAPVVRVQAQGAAVVASLQSSSTQTLQPVGLDITGPTAAPAARQVIVGLVTPPPGQGVASNVVTASVRLLAPSDAVTATIRIFALGALDPVGTPVEVPLEAGVPLEVDIPGLAPGTYTIEVDATSAVVAAGWSASAADGERDNAWIAASPAVEEPTLVAVAPAPPDSSPAFRVTAGDAPVQLTLSPLDGGTPVTLALTAGESASASLGPGIWRVEATETVFASIGYATASSLAAYPVLPSAGAVSTVVIVP